MQMLLTTPLDLSKRKGKMSVLWESKVCVITRRYAREGARVFLAGRTQSKCDQAADEWLRPALSNALVAVRLVHGCTAMEGTHARSCV
jgi:hypothetical protein